MKRMPVETELDPHNPFPFVLRRARLAKGLTLADVASCLEMTPGFLSYIENDKRAPLSDRAIRSIAPMLGVPARELIAAAAISRGVFELEVFLCISEKQLQLGSALIHHWEHLLPEEVEAMLKILARSEPSIAAERPSGESPADLPEARRGGGS